MSRGTKILGFSVPKGLAEEYERMAKDEQKTKSALFREMIKQYKEAKEVGEFKELQSYGAKQAAETGIETEDDVLRLIHEGRGV